MDWVEDLGKVGIKDVHQLDLVVPPQDVDTATARMLPKLKDQMHRETMTEHPMIAILPL